MTNWHYILLSLLLYGPLQAQYELSWEFEDVEELEVKLPEGPVADSMQALQLANTVVLELWDKSFLLASVDTIYIQDSLITARIFQGAPIRWASLENGNVPEPVWQKAGLKPKAFYNRRAGFGQALNIREKLLRQFEEQGFPFVKVWLDSLKFEGERLSAKVFTDPGPKIYFGELELEGDARIEPSYLENYLGIKAGTPYRYSQVQLIRDRLAELPFLQERQRPMIVFRGNEAIVQLLLERQNASRFDFLIGIQPSGEIGSDRNFTITGKLESEFWNQFGRGERLFAKFERLQPGTQSLDLGFTYPYIADLPFGIDLGFRQYRRDSTFNDIGLDLGLRYLFSGENYLELFWTRTGSNLLSVDVDEVINSRSLPANLDYRTTTFGLEGQFESLDYRFNPRRGWRLRARSGVGNKEIIRSTLITGIEDPEDPTFKFGTLYDSLEEKSLQVHSRLLLEYFVPLFKASTMRLAAQSGWIYSPAPIYQNEQFRIGGIKLLRGFDEETLFASMYHIFTLEYRLLSGRNSNFFVFGDYGYVENKRSDLSVIDHPYGFGGGITFETAAGLFSLSLAVGGRDGLSPDFRNPKVHLGYLSIF
ncbi:MAG: BamA/TamA family outer membrane protein [Bacteroidetes bacterium]|nr:BamA/TamA family outer membrane protein [Bacteroidota bacterium]